MTQPVEILYEDGDIIVVSKASGTPAIPERYAKHILSAFDILKAERPQLFIVHRIDKETSGVLVFCKTQDALRNLSAQFAGHSLRKTYLVLLEGRASPDEIRCDAALKPDGDRRHRTIAARDGKESVTLFKVLERLGAYTFAEALPETGRTHQIRAHAAHLGYPVVCDTLYGPGSPLLLSAVKRGYRPPADGEKPLLERLALLAAALELLHPISGEPLRIEAPLPRDFRAALTQLRKL
jgi:RluA family pseudouridine synthase